MIYFQLTDHQLSEILKCVGDWIVDEDRNRRILICVKKRSTMIITNIPSIYTCINDRKEKKGKIGKEGFG